MAITVDQANIGTLTADPGGGTIALVTSQTVASNAFIVVGVGWSTTVATTLSSVAGGGLTWTVDNQTSSATNWACGVASAQAPSGLASGTTITATFSAGSNPSRSIGGISFLGVKTTSPIDTTTTEVSVEDGPAPWVTNSATLTAGSVLVGVAHAANCGSSHAPAGGSTEAFEALDTVDGYGTVIVYRIEAAGGAYTVGGTWGTTGYHKNIAAAYLSDAPAAAAPSLFTVRSAIRLR